LADDQVLKEEAVRFKTGQLDAFDRVKRDSEYFINRAFANRFLDRDEAKEAEDDFMSNLASKIYKYEPRPGCKFTTWLFECINRSCNDYARKRTARAKVGIEKADEQITPSLGRLIKEEVMEPGDDVEHYRRGATEYILSFLPPEQRDLIRLEWTANFPRKTIAADLGISVNTLRKRIFDANQNLEAVKQWHVEALNGIGVQYAAFRNFPSPMLPYIHDLAHLAEVPPNMALNLYGLTSESKVGRATAAGSAGLLKRIGATWDEAARVIRMTFAEEHGHAIASSLVVAGRQMVLSQTRECDRLVISAEMQYEMGIQEELNEIRDRAAREFTRWR
jgi:RNA polymerase sigma factor (sigma-70 family)